MYLQKPQNECFVNICLVNNVHKAVNNSYLRFLHVDKFVDFNMWSFSPAPLSIWFHYAYFTYTAERLGDGRVHPISNI